MVRRRHLRLTSLLPVVLASAVGSDELWDRPAIDVHPSHEAMAQSPRLPPRILAEGQRLFEARFNRLDGAGRPATTGDSKPTLRRRLEGSGFSRTSGLDANSCAGCHHQPRVGGSGEFAANVFVGANLRDPPATSILPQVTSERNTIGLFGSGLVEMLAREMTVDLHELRDAALQRARETGRPFTARLETKGVAFGSLVASPDGSYDAAGVEGVDPDLVIKPFAAKGVVVSLREFTVNALNQHHGIQAIERFGWERTGLRDFDDDGVLTEFTVGQTTALVLFQAALEPPIQELPSSPRERQAVLRGRELFLAVGCGECHRPALPLEAKVFTEPNPFNRPGNLLPQDAPSVSLPLPRGGGPSSAVQRGRTSGLQVALFSDLKRHRICDTADPFFCNERLKQDKVAADRFLTAKLWDAGSSSPYGHRGDCDTLSEAILHHSAEGAASRARFLGLPRADKEAVVAFLASLRVPGLPPAAAGVAGQRASAK
jgi:hypothetical protein